jgi:hypothetical protein
MVVSPRRDDLDVLRGISFVEELHVNSYVKNQRGVDRSHGHAGYVLWGGVQGTRYERHVSTTTFLNVVGWR